MRITFLNILLHYCLFVWLLFLVRAFFFLWISFNSVLLLCGFLPCLFVSMNVFFRVDLLLSLSSCKSVVFFEYRSMSTPSMKIFLCECPHVLVIILFYDKRHLRRLLKFWNLIISAKLSEESSYTSHVGISEHTQLKYTHVCILLNTCKWIYVHQRRNALCNVS